MLYYLQIIVLGCSVLVFSIFNTSVFATNPPANLNTSNMSSSKLQFTHSGIEGSALFYAYSGDQAKPGLLFIHGTPGSWSAFKSYLTNPALQRDFFMVSVDRLGWGNSSLQETLSEGEFSAQSHSLGSVFKQYEGKQWVVVGHSLGASIAPQLAVDYPDHVKGLLLLAGSLKPRLGAPRWYNYAANTWLVSHFLSPSIRYSNREIMNLRSQLKRMDTQIKTAKLDSNVIILQGAKDRLVSPKNPGYATTEWGDSFASIKAITLKNEGHFLPWRQAPKVTELIYELAH